MAETQDQMRIRLLAAILCSYATNDFDKKLVDNFINPSETTYKERIIELSCAITDGLLYGNWPWTIARMKNQKGQG